MNINDQRPIEYRPFNEAIKPTKSALQENKYAVSGFSFEKLLKKTAPSVDDQHHHRSAATTEQCNNSINEIALKPELADALVRDFAYESLGLLVFSVAEYPILRIVTTGEIYTPEIQAQYDRTWEAWQPGRIALYEAELSKGTSAAEILKKLWLYNDTLPSDFLNRAGW